MRLDHVERGDHSPGLADGGRQVADHAGGGRRLHPDGDRVAGVRRGHAPAEGLEPSTCRLTAGRSAIELRGIGPGNSTKERPRLRAGPPLPRGRMIGRKCMITGGGRSVPPASSSSPASARRTRAAASGSSLRPFGGSAWVDSAPSTPLRSVTNADRPSPSGTSRVSTIEDRTRSCTTSGTKDSSPDLERGRRRGCPTHQTTSVLESSSQAAWSTSVHGRRTSRPCGVRTRSPCTVAATTSVAGERRPREHPLVLDPELFGILGRQGRTEPGPPPDGARQAGHPHQVSLGGAPASSRRAHRPRSLVGDRGHLPR